MNIVILAAFQDELTHIFHLFPDLKETQIAKCRCWVTQWDHHDITLSLTGIGTNAAVITTTFLCEALDPDLILFCGVAGGLKSDQRVGDLVLASKIIDADLYQLPAILDASPYQNALTDPHTLQPITIEYGMHDSLSDILASFSYDRLTAGIIVTSNTFPAPKSLFSEIKNLGCSAIDMESSGLYKAAAYHDVPVITLRAISNLLDDEGRDLGTQPDALTICAQRLASCLLGFLKQMS